MTHADAPSLHITNAAMGFVMSLLGQGVGIMIHNGLRLDSLLLETLEIPRSYLKERIQTLLVNGQAIDQEDQVRLQEGDTIALGAVMPGLVGMTLRKAGYLAPMRKEISFKERGHTSESGVTGIVKVKLFNLVAREIGPQILARGVWIAPESLSSFERQFPPDTRLPESLPSNQWIRLIIATRKD
jgi:hypothetical protein